MESEINISLLVGNSLKFVNLLDESKRKKELETKVMQYKDFYKKIKTERNKYVNLIQNLNHDKAERKQKIKTLENELDILKKNVHDKGKQKSLY